MSDHNISLGSMLCGLIIGPASSFGGVAFFFWIWDISVPITAKVITDLGGCIQQGQTSSLLVSTNC